MGYLRLHGRNKENWFRKGIPTSRRYDYWYDETELREFVDAVRAMRNEASRVFVMFNNCHEAAGIKNALVMQEMIETCQPGLLQHSMGTDGIDRRPRQGCLTDNEERETHGD